MKVKLIEEHTHVNSKLNSDSLTMNMTQYRKMKTTEKTTKVTRGSSRQFTYIPKDYNNTLKMTKRTSTDIYS